MTVIDNMPTGNVGSGPVFVATSPPHHPLDHSLPPPYSPDESTNAYGSHTPPTLEPRTVSLQSYPPPELKDLLIEL